EATEAAGESEEEDFDLDLDLGETAESEITVVGSTEEEEFELDLDLGETAEGKETPAGEAEEEFDLDLDLNIEETAGTTGEGEDEFDLDLDFEPGGATAESTDDDLSFDLDLEEALVTTEATAESAEDFDLDLDLGDEPAEEPEVDLEEADEFLDLDLEEAPVKPVESEKAEDEFDLGLEMAAEPTEEKGATKDEFDLDLETMLDEEEEVVDETDKEISLETIGDGGIREEYKGSEPPELEMEAWAKGSDEIQEPEPVVSKPVEPAPQPEPEEERETETTQTFEVTEESAVMAFAKKDIPAKKAIIIVCAAAALLALLIVGAYLMFGKKAVGPQVKDAGNLFIEISEIPSYAFVQNGKAGELLVVSGTVTNRYDSPRRRIKVQASLFDASGKLIITSTAISGISLDDNELKSLEIKAINDKLNNRKGDKKFELPLKSGQKIPFTVVFSNLPDNMDELSCEVVASSLPASSNSK
ncbi:MAG: DUF3426 domain-containing protein, partial [Deltaproteobacteria bacterium]|nr:DUF3426 domain-containing protein [Deltaproteobacteria bacterium]